MINMGGLLVTDSEESVVLEFGKPLSQNLDPPLKTYLKAMSS
jgi:hypothetical protein